MTAPRPRAPRDDAEWALFTEKRLRALESRQSVRIGSWVISEVDGKPIATGPGGKRLELDPEASLRQTTSDLERGMVVMGQATDSQITTLTDTVAGQTGGGLNGVTDRLQNLDTGTGQVDAAGLDNMANMPSLIDTPFDAGGNPVKAFLDGLVNAFLGGGAFSLASIFDVFSAALNVQGTSTGAAQASSTAIGLLNFSSNQSIWGAQNPTLETTIPIGTLTRQTTTGDFSTDPHNFAVTQSASAMGFIRCRQSAVKDMIQWVGRGNTSITGCKVHVYRMDTPGDLTWIYTGVIPTGSLGGGSAWVLVTHAVTVPIDVTPAEVLAVEICVTGAGSHSVAGLTLPWAPSDSSIRPKKLGASRNSATESSAPSTILDAAVGYDADIPYIGAGIGSPVNPLYTYFDDFNGALDQWTPLTGSFTATSGTLRTGTTDPSFMVFNFPVSTDRMRVRALMGRADFGDLFDIERQRLLICCDQNGTNYVGLEFDPTILFLDAGMIRIVTGTSPTAVTVRAWADNTWPASGSEYVYYTFEYDGVNTYNAYMGIDTVPFLSWTDTVGEVSHGPGERRAAVFAQRNPGADLMFNMLIQDVG